MVWFGTGRKGLTQVITNGYTNQVLQAKLVSQEERVIFILLSYLFIQFLEHQFNHCCNYPLLIENHSNNKGEIISRINFITTRNVVEGANVLSPWLLQLLGTPTLAGASCQQSCEIALAQVLLRTYFFQQPLSVCLEENVLNDTRRFSRHQLVFNFSVACCLIWFARSQFIFENEINAHLYLFCRTIKLGEDCAYQLSLISTAKAKIPN